MRTASVAVHVGGHRDGTWDHPLMIYGRPGVALTVCFVDWRLIRKDWRSRRHPMNYFEINISGSHPVGFRYCCFFVSRLRLGHFPGFETWCWHVLSRSRENYHPVKNWSRCIQTLYRNTYILVTCPSRLLPTLISFLITYFYIFFTIEIL
jgi:hypothetical protein